MRARVPELLSTILQFADWEDTPHCQEKMGRKDTGVEVGIYA